MINKKQRLKNQWFGSMSFQVGDLHYQVLSIGWIHITPRDPRDSIRGNNLIP